MARWQGDASVGSHSPKVRIGSVVPPILLLFSDKHNNPVSLLNAEHQPSVQSLLQALRHTQPSINIIAGNNTNDDEDEGNNNNNNSIKIEIQGAWDVDKASGGALYKTCKFLPASSDFRPFSQPLNARLSFSVPRKLKALETSIDMTVIAGAYFPHTYTKRDTQTIETHKTTETQNAQNDRDTQTTQHFLLLTPSNVFFFLNRQTAFYCALWRTSIHHSRAGTSSITGPLIFFQEAQSVVFKWYRYYCCS